MRLFIAINLNTETRSQLLSLRDTLRSCSQRGNFSRPENLHLTLAFVGECTADQATAIKATMDTIQFDPFDLLIERIGRFKRNGGDIWWAGVSGNPLLLQLQRELTAGLADAGFNIEKRGYKPHITLGREVITDVTPWQIASFGETISGIDLMKSEHIGGKLTYTAIYTKRVVGA